MNPAAPDWLKSQAISAFQAVCYNLLGPMFGVLRTSLLSLAHSNKNKIV
jgi:hypothetical protein